MAGSDSDSSLSDAPSLSPEPQEEPTPIPSPPPTTSAAASKSKAKKPARKASTQASTEGSRRSSRVAASRSTSPDKSSIPPENAPSPPRSAASVPKIKLVIRKPEAPAPIPEEAAEDTSSSVRKRKPSLAKARADEEVRERAANKKAKRSHPNRDGPVVENQEAPPLAEPVKKGTAVKRVGKRAERETDLSDLFGDDEDEEDPQPEAGPSRIVPEPKPVAVPVKTKKGSKAKRPLVEDFAEPAESADQVAVPERLAKASKKGRTSLPSQNGAVAQAPVEQERPRKGKARSAVEDDKSSTVIPPADLDPQPANKSSTSSGRKGKRAVQAEETVLPATIDQDVKMEEAATLAPETVKTEENPRSTKGQKNKTFAQAVTGSPVPLPNETEPDPPPAPPQAKKEKRNLSAIPKIAKLASTASPLSTPQSSEKKPTLSGSSNIKKATPAAAQPKKVVQAPSLLESTLATLHAAQAGSSTPKKEEAKSMPKPAKVYAKGEWTDEWVLSATEQREVYESRSEREAARAKRMEWRKNPVNLQEAKDAYRLDSTVARVLPPLQPLSAMGIRTEGAPSRLVAAFLGLPAPGQTA